MKVGDILRERANTDLAIEARARFHAAVFLGYKIKWIHPLCFHFSPTIKFSNEDTLVPAVWFNSLIAYVPTREL